MIKYKPVQVCLLLTIVVFATLWHKRLLQKSFENGYKTGQAALTRDDKVFNVLFTQNLMRLIDLNRLDLVKSKLSGLMYMSYYSDPEVQNILSGKVESRDVANWYEENALRHHPTSLNPSGDGSKWSIEDIRQQIAAPHQKQSNDE